MGLTITYNEDGVEAEIKVAKANVRRGLLRTALSEQGLTSTVDEPPILRTARWMQYPALIAGTVAGLIDLNGERVMANEISFEQFLDLPEPLVTAWLEGVFKLNAHWLYRPPDEDDEEGNE